jgi:CheY-like chemotaxis protein
MTTQKVLVVDDEVAYSAIIGMVLEAFGLEAEIVPSATEAYYSMKNATPDLILVDIMMPEVDGMTFVRWLRTTRTWGKVPVVAISALSMPEDRQEAIEAGVDDFLSKPFTPDELREKIRPYVAADEI